MMCVRIYNAADWFSNTLFFLPCCSSLSATLSFTDKALKLQGKGSGNQGKGKGKQTSVLGTTL